MSTHPDAAYALERIQTDPALVPSIWWFEVRNTMVVNERRNRLTESDTAAFLRLLGRLRVSTDGSPDEVSTLRLAQRENVPLTTLDQALAAAARAERVSQIP